MHCRKVRLLAIVAIALSSCALAGPADYWRWTGSDGTVHYGETPPPGIKAERIHVSTGTSESGPDASAQDSNGTSTGPDQTASAGKGAAGAATKSSAKPADNKKVCEQAKANLAVLQNSTLVSQTDANGKQHVLSEDQKTSQIKLAHDIIKQYCK